MDANVLLMIRSDLNLVLVSTKTFCCSQKTPIFSMMVLQIVWWLLWKSTVSLIVSNWFSCGKCINIYMNIFLSCLKMYMEYSMWFLGPRTLHGKLAFIMGSFQVLHTFRLHGTYMLYCVHYYNTDMHAMNTYRKKAPCVWEMHS